MHYFVRVNGETLHNNPNDLKCYVPGEPPTYPKRDFNYLRFCLTRDIVRIGCPDTGDLLAGGKSGALSNCYDLDEIEPQWKSYLTSFRNIPVGAIVLVPDKAQSGDICIGVVTRPYHYFHDVPRDPYECAHRLGVRWDRHPNAGAIVYKAADLGISTRGGFWTRAFHVIERSGDSRFIIARVDQARTAKLGHSRV